MGIEFIGCDHGMNTESFDAFFFTNFITFKKLFPREAVFCLLGMTDYNITFFQSAGIVAEANQ